LAGEVKTRIDEEGTRNGRDISKIELLCRRKKWSAVAELSSFSSIK
jgi:hypothetical protein